MMFNPFSDSSDVSSFLMFTDKLILKNKTNKII